MTWTLGSHPGNDIVLSNNGSQIREYCGKVERDHRGVWKYSFLRENSKNANGTLKHGEKVLVADNVFIEFTDPKQ